MNWQVPTHRGTFTPDAHVRLWLVALVFFGIGDLVTTSIGYGIDGVTELSPVVAFLVRQHALFVLVALKTAVCAAFFALWWYVPQPHSMGIPLGLAVLGVAVTLWNTAVILFAVAG